MVQQEAKGPNTISSRRLSMSPTPSQRFGVGKLYHKWRGPYVIQEFTDYDNVKLMEQRTRKTILVHISRIQPFFVDNEALYQWTKSVVQAVEDSEALNEDQDAQDIIEDQTEREETGIIIESEFLERRRRNRSGRYIREVLRNGQWINIVEAMVSEDSVIQAEDDASNAMGQIPLRRESYDLSLDGLCVAQFIIVQELFTFKCLDIYIYS